jgi:hypothetical protein
MWTGKHVALVVAGLVLGLVASLLCFGLAMFIEVRSERLSDLFIVLWQYLANGSLLWLLTIGFAMSLALGREEAKVAVLQFGAERATFHAVAIGGAVSLLSGLAFYLAPIVRLPFVVYVVFSVGVSLFAARWHFESYAIQSHWWVAVGLTVPVFLLILAPVMIERDRQQRRVAIEQVGEGRGAENAR